MNQQLIITGKISGWICQDLKRRLTSLARVCDVEVQDFYIERSWWRQTLFYRVQADKVSLDWFQRLV